MNIVLIGYRGSGKSSIGKRLAKKLWMEFADTDLLIVERASAESAAADARKLRTIADIFDAEGEAGFRTREAAVIAEVSQRDNHVIAAGGGAILRPENVAALKKNAKVIWLQASAETLWKRIQADTETVATRPNLTLAGGLEEIKSVLEQRLPLYQAAADAKLDVTYLGLDDVLGYLAKLI